MKTCTTAKKPTLYRKDGSEKSCLFLFSPNSDSKILSRNSPTIMHKTCVFNNPMISEKEKNKEYNRTMRDFAYGDILSYKTITNDKIIAKV